MDQIFQNVAQLKQMLLSSYVHQPPVLAAGISQPSPEMQDQLTQLQQQTFAKQQNLLDACFGEIQRAMELLQQSEANHIDKSQINEALQSQVQRQNMEISQLQHRTASQQDDAAKLKSALEQAELKATTANKRLEELRNKHETLLVRAKRLREVALEQKQREESLNAAVTGLKSDINRLEELLRHEQEQKALEIQALRGQTAELEDQLAMRDSQIRQLQIPRDMDVHQRLGLLMQQNKNLYDEVQKLTAANSVLQQDAQKSEKDVVGDIKAIVSQLRETIEKADFPVVFPSKRDYQEVQRLNPDIDFRALGLRNRAKFQKHLSSYKDKPTFCQSDERNVLAWIRENIRFETANSTEPRTGLPLFDSDSSELGRGTSASYLTFLMWLQDNL